MTALSLRARRLTLEAEMDADKATFHEVGKALVKLGPSRIRAYLNFSRRLLEIQTAKLYEPDYDSWEAYCEQRWGISRQYGNRLTLFAEVSERVAPDGDNLPTESQARELAKAPEGLQATVWDAATGGGAKSPTASDIAALLEKAKQTAAEDDEDLEDLSRKPPEEQQRAIEASEQRAIEQDRRESGGQKDLLEQAVRLAKRLLAVLNKYDPGAVTDGQGAEERHSRAVSGLRAVLAEVEALPAL